MVATGAEIAALRRRVTELTADVARHEAAEARRLESDEIHRITLENISDAVFIADDTGSLTFICPNVEVIFGRSREEVRALGNISKLLGEGLFDPARLEAEGEIQNIERWIVDGAGSSHALIVSVKRVDILGGTVLYTCRDVSDRKIVEDALQRSEARLREAQSIARMGFWDWNIVTNELYWSDEIYRIFGLSKSDFGATSDAVLESIHPDDRAFVQRKVDAAVHEGAEYSIDHRVVRPFGEIRFVHELGRVTRDEGGKPRRMVGTVIDITARKQAEDDRNAAEARARSAEELAALGTLIAGLAHDVGTPVNVILGYARMMEQSLADEKERERARVISEQANRVASLIQTLMNVARPSERMHVPVSVEDTLESALAFMREKLGRIGVEVVRHFRAAPEVRGDPDRLQQVFLNLFMNAADAMPGGGVLEVGVEPIDRDSVEITIRDTGAGIPEESLGRIFDPFFTTKPRGQGTGLGLLVSRRIVMEHAGSIDATRRPGGGTCFRIRLPADAGRLAATASPASRRPS